MGMRWDEEKRQYIWTGNIRDLVAAVGNGDARMGFVVDAKGFVVDAKSGAKISMDIAGVAEEGDEPFLVESPDGDNMYNAYNRKEAVKLLSNIRKGIKYPDMDTASSYPHARKATKKSKSGQRAGLTNISVRSIR